MDKAEAKKRIEKLKREINHHRYLYHVLDRQEISDAALDSLKHELDELEKEYPEFITSDSPSQRVGGKPLGEFKKVRHAQPMLSLNDAFEESEFYDWLGRIKKLVPLDNIDFYSEIKMDGLAITLIYRDGVFELGATRGDGRIGEDITQNLKTVEAIPLKIDFDRLPVSARIKAEKEVEVRGEVYMTKAVLERLNLEQNKKGESPFANPRNAAAGSVRQLDSKVTAKRRLSFYAYDLVTDLGQETHEQSHEFIKLMGFPVNPHNQRCPTPEAVIKYYRHIEKLRPRLPYWIDGVVVNVNNIITFKKLGVVGKAPRAALAFKYPAEQATTVVEDIQVQVGRAGALTPVAHLRPVRVAGSVISRATLHNMDEIERLDVRIGDTVIIQKAGDVIPDVVKVLPGLRSGHERKFHMPRVCPVCGSLVKKKEGEVAYYCANKRCFAQNRERLYHFVSKNALNIDGLGPKIIDSLMASGLIKDQADIFALKKEDLQDLERFAERSATNIIEAIEKAKRVTLARFIFSLGIRHVGEETAFDLARRFSSLDKIKNASQEEINQIPDVGEVVSRSIFEFFQEKANLKLIDKMQANGLIIEREEGARKQTLKGKTFVLTGTLQTMTRDNAKQKIRDLGGDASSSVSEKTDYLVAGENPGSKYAHARKFGVKIISEKQFLEMVK